MSGAHPVHRAGRQVVHPRHLVVSFHSVERFGAQLVAERVQRSRKGSIRKRSQCALGVVVAQRQDGTDEAARRVVEAFGFALEQFDAVGRRRPNKVDTRTSLPDGTKAAGLGGLRDYLAQKRRKDIVRQFSRKLLGFALGREVILSDEPFLDELQQKLAAHDYRFHTAVEAIVLSPQFRRVRGKRFVAAAAE